MGLLKDEWFHQAQEDTTIVFRTNEIFLFTNKKFKVSSMG